MPARRTVRRALLGGAGVAAATVALAAANNRRWARAADPTGGGPFALPAGRERVVSSFDGAELWLTELGDGDPSRPLVVLSHCWTGDHRVWAPVARRLLDDHRVVLYDQRGHGRSSVGTAGLTLEALAADLRAVLEAVDARDAVLAGHSMGGMSAQLLAVHHPDTVAERVRHLVLVATAGESVTLHPAQERVMVSVVGNPLAGKVVASTLLGPSAVRGAFGRSPHLAAVAATAETFIGTAPAVRAGMLSALAGLDLADALPGVDVPASIVVGTLDTLTPVPRARRMHELLPTSTLHILPGRGHMLPFEAPDEVAALIREAREDRGR